MTFKITLDNYMAPEIALFYIILKFSHKYMFAVNIVQYLSV